MQLYRGSTSSFIETTKQNQIALKLKEAYFNHFGFYPSVNEEMSWRNSLRAIKDVFADCGFNEQGVALEYFLPSTSLRLDCMITGKDKDNKDSAVIIELKQWQSTKRCDSENEVVTRLSEGMKEVLHPSFQVNRYKEYFKEFYEVFYEENPINLTACSYLHNYSYEENDPILDKKFEEILDKAPVFSLDEFDDIKDYIFEKVSYGEGITTLDRINESKKRPSKKLMDTVSNTIKSHSEYFLLEESEGIDGNNYEIPELYRSVRIEEIGDKGWTLTPSKSNFHIVIVVDMWITGFDVPSLTYMYNDKPLQKHQLIQTISRVNRKYPGKEYGLIVDYIGIRDNMRQAMKIYGGDTSVAPTEDDVKQATSSFRDELGILKNLFIDYDLKQFLDPNCNPIDRYTLLAKAAEYVFKSTEELKSENNNGKTLKVSFKTYFLKTVKRMRLAFDICQPSGELGEEESALAQCFMAIAGFVRKMGGTIELDTETMNKYVSKMVEEALKYNKVESILDGEQEDIFSPEYFEKLSDIKMPASKLEILVKMLKKQIKEYSKVNQLAAKKFQEMLEKTIQEYHERRKHLSIEEAGETQEQASEDIILKATEQALQILKEMNESRESFRKMGLTFEEKAFYDILIALRDQYNFEYGEDKEIDGVIINDKCKSLAKKVKEIIDTKSSFADWLNNQNVRNDLKLEIKICLVKNGYPPQYSPEVFNKVMEQVENFEENSN